MTYYSLRDLQCSGRIMAVGRNSTDLEDMFWQKMEYHSDLDEDIDNMYEKSVEGMVVGCMDFEFNIVKHYEPFKENEDNEIINHYIEQHDLTFDEAVKEFSYAQM